MTNSQAKTTATVPLSAEDTRLLAAALCTLQAEGVTLILSEAETEQLTQRLGIKLNFDDALATAESFAKS